MSSIVHLYFCIRIFKTSQSFVSQICVDLRLVSSGPDLGVLCLSYCSYCLCQYVVWTAFPLLQGHTWDHGRMSSFIIIDIRPMKTKCGLQQEHGMEKCWEDDMLIWWRLSVKLPDHCGWPDGETMTVLTWDSGWHRVSVVSSGHTVSLSQHGCVQVPGQVRS